jgi:ubiquinone/menaquinone biosynthesis C-methylase UbiE
MKTISLLSILAFVACSSGSHVGHSGHGHHHRFNDAKRWAKVFEDEKRELWQRPSLVINRVGVKDNSVVADIGSATGYFPVRLAAKAQKGKVWAIDIEPNLVNFLNKRVQEEKNS